MGKLKAWFDDFEIEDEMLKEPDKYWRTAQQRYVLIAEMDTEHLENVVNFFSRDGWVVDPTRQNAFDNVMIEYLKRKLDNEVLLKKAISLMEDDHEHTKMPT